MGAGHRRRAAIMFGSGNSQRECIVWAALPFDHQHPSYIFHGQVNMEEVMLLEEARHPGSQRSE